MREQILILLILISSVLTAFTASPDSTYTAVMAADGRNLAEEIRNLRPLNETTLRGVLKRKEKDGSVKSLIIISKIIPQDDKWLTIYEAVNPDNSAYEELTIIHSPSQKNRYIYKSSKDKTIENPDLTLPFAGSDFSFGDLGLEFFHWQRQYLLKTEMRKSRVCRVLESRSAQEDRPLGYSRVVSWIDKETGGILIAEAYDNSGKKVKQFEVNSFRKDENGNWQIEEIEIRNLILKTKTQLIFQSAQTQ